MTIEASPSKSENPLVSVVLVNYRTPDMTLECIESLVRQCRAVSSEIIVVDNGSGDDSPGRLCGSPRKPIVVQLPDNVGFGAGCNAGARVARGKYIYLLNTDTLMEEDSVRILAEFLEGMPSAVAAGSRLCRPDRTVQPSAFLFPTPLRVLLGSEKVGLAIGRRFPWLEGSLSMFLPPERLAAPCSVDWCSGASLMVQASAYREIGGFDEEFFLYAEEIDLCRRLRRHGGVWYAPGTTVVHLEGASHEEGAVSPRRMGYMAAGRRLYYRKHHSRCGAWLCNLADGGGALVKGLVLKAASLWGRNPRAERRAQEQLVYARSYFRYSYPLQSVSGADRS